MYNFQREDAMRFSNEVSGRKKVKNNELVFETCPYCRGTGDNKYKFSINLTTGQFECKRASCGAKGNMLTLSRDFNFQISEEMDRYYNRNGFNDKFRKFKDAKRQIESKPAAIKYCMNRGISEEVCKKYELTVRDDNENVLVFPFKDANGVTTFIKYRNMKFVKGETQGSKEWCESNCMPILFGMNHCEDFTRLVVTEGQMDSLSLASAGIKNAVSVPTGANGFTWLPHCWNWLIQFDELVVFGDYEKGEITLADTLSKRFPKKVSIVRKEDYLDCKDANEILQKHGPEAVKAAVDNAEVVPVAQIERLSDVKAIDLRNTPCIKTEIKELDKLLSGGLHVGQLIVLTGKRGDGKSTWMSQIIVNATAQEGWNTFAYSGELPDYYFRNWMDSQIAGKSFHEIRQSEGDLIGRWYHDRIFLFRNEVRDIDEQQDLLKIVELAICQYNCNLICLDNLMTALDSSLNDDLYRAQSSFVGKLASMAKLYNVVIILVAHPRKSVKGEAFGNDDIAGSSGITDRADVVLNYFRGQDMPDDIREIQVTKNRLNGKLTGNRKEPILAYYDEQSKRVCDDRSQFRRVYNYDDSANGFMAVEQEELPFHD